MEWVWKNRGKATEKNVECKIKNVKCKTRETLRFTFYILHFVF